MAAGNMKQIKRRIKSVSSTMQITKAMELVASSKVRRAKERVERSKPYFETLFHAVERIAKQNREKGSIYTKPREIKNSLFIVIAGDRGMAGGYNSNVFKMTAEAMKGKQVSVITIGKKAQEYYAKRNIKSVADHVGIAETMRIADTHAIVNQSLELYEQGVVDEVYLCYTEFVSSMTQVPQCKRLLPIHFEHSEMETEKSAVLTEYDPSPEAVLKAVVPEYLNGLLYGAVVESFASEQSARRMAMESASDNASEMIQGLNLSYNRARQASITQEITEIISGSGQIGS